MAVTTATKMLSGIVVFVIMARVLGPHDFGLVVYSFTLASIFVLLVDYGFSQQLLRDIGAAPKAIHQIMGRVLIAKVALSIAMLIICAIYLLLFPKDKTTEIVFLLLLLSSILVSFSEFLNVGFRGIGQFKTETNIATMGAAIHFALLTSILLIKADVIGVSYAFIISRVIYLVISWQAYKKHIGIIQIEKNMPNVIQTLKTGFPYAADAGFTNLFQQVDTIIVNHYLGLAGVGLYQAATKWLQGAMQFAPVLANVYLPTLSANTEHIDVNNSYAQKLNIQMLVIGVSGWAFFTFAASHLSSLIYGEKYQEISRLWPYVGLLMLTRYIAASQGVILVAYGKQKIRVFVQVVSLSVFLISSVLLIQHFGLVGTLVALVLTFTTTFVIYLYNLIKFNFPTGYSKITSMLSAMFFIAAILFSYLKIG